MKLITGIDSKGKIVDVDIFNEGLRYFAGQRVVLRCDKEKQKRTINQNDALWRWNEMLANDAGTTPNEMHYLMCGEIFGYKNIKIYDKRTTEVKILLKEVDVPRKTTSKLTTIEFSEYITNYFNKAQELFNYSLPPFGWE